MSECGRLSDRMPAVALDRSTWTEEEAAHLGDCASCTEEWNLLRSCAHLGTAMAAELDPAATTRAVLDRLAQSQAEARLRRKSFGFAALASAAAAAVIVWAGQTAPQRAEPVAAPVVVSLQIPLPELEYLLPAELNAVLRALDEPNMGGAVEDTAVGDPDDVFLESGFDTWEG